MTLIGCGREAPTRVLLALTHAKHIPQRCPTLLTSVFVPTFVVLKPVSLSGRTRGSRTEVSDDTFSLTSSDDPMLTAVHRSSILENNQGYHTRHTADATWLL